MATAVRFTFHPDETSEAPLNVVQVSVAEVVLKDAGTVQGVMDDVVVGTFAPEERAMEIVHLMEVLDNAGKPVYSLEFYDRKELASKFASGKGKATLAAYDRAVKEVVRKYGR